MFLVYVSTATAWAHGLGRGAGQLHGLDRRDAEFRRLSRRRAGADGHRASSCRHRHFRPRRCWSARCSRWSAQRHMRPSSRTRSRRQSSTRRGRWHRRNSCSCAGDARPSFPPGGRGLPQQLAHRPVRLVDAPNRCRRRRRSPNWRWRSGRSARRPTHVRLPRRRPVRVEQRVVFVGVAVRPAVDRDRRGCRAPDRSRRARACAPSWSRILRSKVSKRRRQQLGAPGAVLIARGQAGLARRARHVHQHRLVGRARGCGSRRCRPAGSRLQRRCDRCPGDGRRAMPSLGTRVQFVSATLV